MEKRYTKIVFEDGKWWLVFEDIDYDCGSMGLEPFSKEEITDWSAVGRRSYNYILNGTL